MERQSTGASGMFIAKIRFILFARYGFPTYAIDPSSTERYSFRQRKAGIYFLCAQPAA